MTATVIGINLQPRCAVCGGRSVKSNRFAMRTDASGSDVMLHLGCMPTWRGWRSGTCDVCGEGDHENDPIGPFLDGKGGEDYLHQRCWRHWKSERELSVNEPKMRDAQRGR
jgi:hypothetical protein